MSETWRDIPGWAGYYAVSDLGRVKSLARTIVIRTGVTRDRKEEVRRPGVDSSGYLSVPLSRDGRKVQIAVHRLVLLAFVGPCPPGLEGCHGDGDKFNNCVSNLRWDTHSANMVDRISHDNNPQLKKTHCPQGHPYDEANTYHWRGQRHCRACIDARSKKHRAKGKPPSDRSGDTTVSHGTPYGYQVGCRCSDCKRAKKTSREKWGLRGD
jgi:hypothetical protein